MLLKLRAFKAYIESVFLYNSELWTLNKRLENVIDVFQRRLFRRILKIKWQDKVSNDNLYIITREKPWSQLVRYRRLKFYGHLLRLPSDTPARKALAEARRVVKKPRGGQRTTWLCTIEKDLRIMGIVGHGLSEAQNRPLWNRLCFQTVYN